MIGSQRSASNGGDLMSSVSQAMSASTTTKQEIVRLRHELDKERKARLEAEKFLSKTKAVING